MANGGKETELPVGRDIQNQSMAFSASVSDLLSEQVKSIPKEILSKGPKKYECMNLFSLDVTFFIDCMLRVCLNRN